MSDNSTINVSELYDEKSEGYVGNLDPYGIEYGNLSDSELKSLSDAARNTAQYISSTSGFPEYLVVGAVEFFSNLEGVSKKSVAKAMNM